MTADFDAELPVDVVDPDLTVRAQWSFDSGLLTPFDDGCQLVLMQIVVH